MSTSTIPEHGRRLAGWSALIAGPLAWLTIYLYLAATGGDMDGMAKPLIALTMPAQALQQFHWSMVIDCFGFYLPFLPVGGYLWARLRPAGGALIDMATLALVAYVLLGVSGAAMQFTALGPLAAAHASGDPMAEVASETTWLAVVNIADHGLWALEGATFAFWGIIVGPAIKKAGMRYGAVLTTVGITYCAFLVAELAGQYELSGAIETIAFVLLPLWAMLSGIDLLRKPVQASVQTRMGVPS